MSSYLSIDDMNDELMENYIREYDKTVMPTPDMEFEPHILLNKVRKHYMEYVIKLLSVNYERNLRVSSNSFNRLPSAIWRCAKGIEISAAQASMVLQIYRTNILAVVQELKNDTMAGKLNKNLHDYLYKAPQNEKRTQTTLTYHCTCQCTCNQRKKVKKTIDSPNIESNSNQKSALNNLDITSLNKQCNLSVDQTNQKPISAKPCDTPSETQNSDDLVQQLEKLFEGNGNDEEDLFEGVLCDEFHDESALNFSTGVQGAIEKQDQIVEAHSAQIKSLDERLDSLAGIINNNNSNMSSDHQDRPEAVIQKPKKYLTSKWLCEEYFLKLKLLNLLDHIRDCDRGRLKGIKQLFVELFGEDSDDEDVMSPVNETPEFILSCKERIAPWVVKVLTPYYVRGRIKGKALFKSLAKHLIRLIYQCSQYPEEYEVHSFVCDFLKTHKVIRCEADFKEFKIMNI